MDTKQKWQKILPVAVILSGLLALQLVWLPKKTEVEQRQYEDKVNLALRQTGHRLLKSVGNTTDAIAPVRRSAGNEFVLQLDSHFNYDSLPAFLKAAFDQYGIHDDYLVTVKDCEAHKLLLGYARLDVEQNNQAPCGGRDQDILCSNIHVVFPDSTVLGAGSTWLEKWLIGGIGLSLAYLLFSFFKQKKAGPNPTLVAANENNPVPHGDNPDSLIRFGQTTFDVANQTVQTGASHQELTFREAKLLHLFCKNANQLLDRNFILQEVWEDEGVIVGRSLDVFVSRLRKILKGDPTVKIANVHGVGYRFEIIENQ